MAKVKSGLLNIGKKATKGNSLVRRTNAFIGRKIGRKGRTIAKKFADINKTTAKGKNNLLNVPKQLELPLNADTPIKKPSIARMARNEVKSFISGAADKIEQQVESFDPKKFLSKIFDGGLSKLTDFGNSLDRMANSGQLEFLERANRLATEFVEKLASGKGGGGFLRVVGNILKIAAGIGVAALAAPFVGPVLGAVATVGGITGGVVLAAKGISDFVRGKGLFKDRKEKVKKKKEEDKFAKINALLEKNLDTIAAAAAKKQIIKEEEQKLEGTSTIDSQENVMGGETLSDATISVTDDGKLVIERKSLSSDNKTIIRTKEDYEKLLEKKKEQYKGYEESGDNKRMAGTQRYIKYYEKVIALMEEKGLEELKVNVKSYKKSGRDGRDGGRGFRGTRGLPGSNLESSAMNIYENARDFALAPPPVKFMQIINAAKDFIFGKPSEATSLETPIGKEEQKAEELKPSTVETDTTEKDLRLEASSEISTSPNAGGGGGGGEAPQVIDMQKDVDAQNAVAGDGPKVPTMSKSGNKIPILFAIDNRNIHLPFTRSVFNIVDAK